MFSRHDVGKMAAAAAAAVLLSLVLVLPAQPQTQACPLGGVPMIACPPISDAVIQGKVSARMFGAISQPPENTVKVTVQNGVAVLAGQVTGEARKSQAARLAAEVSGVVRVDNRIEVVPQENRDFRLVEQVRGELTRSLGNFSRVNVWAADGIVQLTGVVSSQLERDIAEVAAGSVEGVDAVHNNLFVRGVRGESGW